jgi:hypothetical protein
MEKDKIIENKTRPNTWACHQPLHRKHCIAMRAPFSPSLTFPGPLQIVSFSHQEINSQVLSNKFSFSH